MTPEDVQGKPPQEFELPQPAPVRQEGAETFQKPEMVSEDEKNRLRDDLNNELLKLLPLSQIYSAELDEGLYDSFTNDSGKCGEWVAWLKNNTPNTEQANDIQYAIEQLQRWNAIFNGFTKQSTQPLTPEPPLSPESPTEPAPNEPAQAEQAPSQEPEVDEPLIQYSGETYPDENHYLAHRIYGEGVNIKSGDQVAVARSDGTRENDWSFLFAEGEKGKSPTTITVRKITSEGKELLKHINIKDFLSWQAEQVPNQEPVKITAEQEPEVAKEVRLGQTPEIPEGSEKLSRKQERINQATQKARERTENFIRDHITPYLELGTAREAGSINIFEKIDERWSKWRMEREMIHLKEALKVTQNNLAVYRQRSAKIEANIGKLSILAEQRPDLEKRLERLKTKLAPEIEELAGLINLQEALLKEYGNSLKVLAGALDVELEEDVEAGINKGIPEISGGGGFSAENTDAYMSQYDSRVDGMFGIGTSGLSKELPRSMQGRRSAIEKFFMWFLGLENGVGLKSQEGVA